MGRSPHCVFCGLRAPGHHKLLEPGYVEALLEAQRAAEVECPISDVMRAQLAKSELAKSELARSDDGEEEALLKCQPPGVARACPLVQLVVPASARQKAALLSPEGCSRAQQEEAREWS